MCKTNIALGFVLVGALLLAGPMAAQNSVRHINAPGLSKPNGYSHVVAVPAGQMIFISGQIAVDADGKSVGAGDIATQTTRVFENLKLALASAGATFANVVKLNFYLTDVSQIQKVRDIRNQYIQGDPPASTLVEVKALVRPELLIEVDAIAVLPASQPKAK